MSGRFSVFRCGGALLLAPLACLMTWAPPAVLAQDSSMTPAERLVEEERLRTAVQAAFNHYYQPVDDGGVKNDNKVVAADMLVEIGPAAVPLLRRQLQQASPYNYTFVAYALGRIGGPEAEAALREAVADAGRDGGTNNTFAKTRRAWACYGLALQGHLDALDLFNGPTQITAEMPIHFQTTMLEAAALLMDPDTVPVLHAQLDRYAEIDHAHSSPAADGRVRHPLPPQDPSGDLPRMMLEDTLESRRIAVIKALRRLGHKESLPRLLALLDDEDPAVRSAAADALHVYDGPEVVAALMRRLKEEPLPYVRFAAAWSLRQLAPQGLSGEFLRLLDEETEFSVRGALYHLAAGDGEPATFDALRKHLGRPDPRDRGELAAAMLQFEGPRATNVLRAALQDRDVNIVLTGAHGLARIGSEKATQSLLDEIGAPHWESARLALAELVKMGERRAIPHVIERLASEMEYVIIDPVVRERAYSLGDALIALRYRGDIDALQEGIARQNDGHLANYLRSMVKQLATLRDNGNDVRRWTESLDDGDPTIRSLAYTVLGELGGDVAATALAGAFGRVETDAGVEILRALGHVDTDGSRALIERVLTQPAFDPFARHALRDMAAYSARRLGGQRMVEALTTAVRRRHGRDATVLLSLLLLQGRAAIPVYEEVRIERMRYLMWRRGLEQETFQRLVADLRAGRSLDFYDRPPAAFDFNRPR